MSENVQNNFASWITNAESYFNNIKYEAWNRELASTLTDSLNLSRISGPGLKGAVAGVGRVYCLLYSALQSFVSFVDYCTNSWGISWRSVPGGHIAGLFFTRGCSCITGGLTAAFPPGDFEPHGFRLFCHWLWYWPPLSINDWISARLLRADKHCIPLQSAVGIRFTGHIQTVNYGLFRAVYHSWPYLLNRKLFVTNIYCLFIVHLSFRPVTIPILVYNVLISADQNKDRCTAYL